MSTGDDSPRLSSSLFINVRSAYRTFGENVNGEGLYFGGSEVYAIYQIDSRIYRLTFSPTDKGILVSASLMLELRGA